MPYKNIETNKFFTPSIKIDFDALDFQKFTNCLNSQKLIDKKIVSKFFKFFLKTEICDSLDSSLESFNENDFLSFKKKSSLHFYSSGNFKDAIFFNTFNKTFNGIVEMLHYNHKVRFPKRFIFLKRNETSSNSFFWDF